MFIINRFSPTTTKAIINTDPVINDQIDRTTEANIAKYTGQPNQEIRKRIKELDYEWDIERTLEINFAVITLISSLFGLMGRKRWLIFSGVAAYYMIKHVLQGWCPPLPLFRRLGIRTAKEIRDEQEALRAFLRS